MSYNKVNQTTGSLEQIAGSQVNSIYADAPLGAIIPYGGTTIPEGWLECDGSAVSRTTYADLFAAISTKFGPGDGSTTFNLPSGDFGAQLYPAFDAMYIIKAIKTVLPTDFQEALEVKQNITDNTLQTISKTVPGAINELNSNLADISTDGTVKTVIWRDYNIQENIERGLPFDMPEDGYVIVRAGAANNSTTTMLTLVVTIQNSLRVAEVILDSPYSEATLSTPYLKKGTPVLINVIMRANTWTSDTRGTIDFTVI